MFSQTLFRNRQEAGRALGYFLLRKKYNDPIVLALPRGGVTIGAEVARILHSSLDVVIARKIGAPGHPEFGIGAISENEVPIFNSVVGDVTSDDVTLTVTSEIKELRRRIKKYREGRELADLVGKTIILVDDGLATGMTAAAAGMFLKTLSPKAMVLAVPVAPREIGAMVRDQFDEIVCLNQPSNFNAVGSWYRDFTQVEDSEVLAILEMFYNKVPLKKKVAIVK